ncbi:MAG: hypothetical protein ISR96_03055 [Nitrospira sp.]|nr:hypothetical protein [Nitrospira sp.]
MSSNNTKRNCPHVKQPLTSCYCFNLSSINISPAIYYCGNNFESCQIYRESMTGSNFETTLSRT